MQPHRAVSVRPVTDDDYTDLLVERIARHVERARSGEVASEHPQHLARVAHLRVEVASEGDVIELCGAETIVSSIQTIIPSTTV